MFHFLNQSINFPALALSVLISLGLLSGLNAGFTPKQEVAVCRVQLPTVIVHGKSVTSTQAAANGSEPFAPTTLFDHSHI